MQKPLELGADIVIHSATKYLGGHSDLTAGVLAGSKKWMDAARQMMILTGGCLDPGCAYLLLRGLKTLDVRVERACRNAAQIAEALQAHPKVARVYYPGLRESRGARAGAAADEGLRHDGVVRHSRRRSARPSASSTSLKLWYLAASLGGVESTVSYPVLSSHIGLSAKQLELAGSVAVDGPAFGGNRRCRRPDRRPEAGVGTEPEPNLSARQPSNYCTSGSYLPESGFR